MFIRIVGEKHNVLFECDRVIETEVGFSFWRDDEIFVELTNAQEEKTHIYAMNNDGKTIDSWSIYPEGK